MRIYEKDVAATATGLHLSRKAETKQKQHDVQVALSPAGASRVLLSLQREHGNRYVQSLLDRVKRSEPAITHGAALTVQRYAVPRGLACDEMVGWLGTNSPYAPEWAENRVNYSFSPRNFVDVQFKDTGEGQVEGTATGMASTRVLMSTPTDLPTWNPSERPNRAVELRAWQSMLAALRAHENEHIRIGTTWRAKLEAKARAVKLTATGSSREDVRGQLAEQLRADAESWIGDAQAEQDQFDIDSDHGAKAYKTLPVVTLTCPAPPSP
jgi:hypothetical protein